ncbi:MAG: nitrite reductase small subunit NirD [Candidatus Hydrogenedentes bacterium]|nr:nitrite reductase small subunit NirD [Candidatus Hydrogenedentota bacterium]
MVGHRFCEKLVEFGCNRKYQVLVLGEEPRPAYDRVNLTSYFEGKSAEDLTLAKPCWYRENEMTLYTGRVVQHIDRDERAVYTSTGSRIPYGRLVLATGSRPLVPPAFKVETKGVFVYRTIDDLDAIIRYGKRCTTASVIGGGLLGLEAARALRELGLETKVIEFNARLMPRQLDETASALLLREIQRQGIGVLLSRSTQSVLGNGAVTGLRFADGESVDTDMIVVSAGIQPRDELARACGLAIGPRGGVVVDDALQTSDPNIYAIGEVASHRDVVYGLVAPGYQMAETLARRMAGEDATFAGGDLSTKLKLMGVNVASFGDPFLTDQHHETFEYRDSKEGRYIKVVLDAGGRTVLGGVLVGDTSSFGLLSHHARTGEPLPAATAELLGLNRSDGAAPALPDTLQVCSCNNVSKAQLCGAIRGGAHDIGALQACTRAGTGCGGCVPIVKDILKSELLAMGVSVKNVLCDHFPMTRQELFHAVKVQRLKSFDAVLDIVGNGDGCEVCKPAVASILASLWNEHVVEHAEIQDTNDRFLANIQRGGSYSIVPRVPGGEITPEKLIALGRVAKKYDLYCKITGGQRIDLLGARVDQLPEIWEELIAEGFESGHAYGKAVRTVKSCVGSTWCRFGVQDSTAFAIRIEERYRGIRAPHKLKFAVSGCTRECAEAQGKDVGLIATEKGWNVYVCGNGGAKPRHADLLATDLDEDTAIRLIDRFLMYYIHTADPLTRTSVWLEKLEGGLDQVKRVVIEDILGICETLEADMAKLVNTYECEWKAVVENPEKRALFKHFSNTNRTDANLKFVRERGQKRPADWPSPAAAQPHQNGVQEELVWWRAGAESDFPDGRGIAVEYGTMQLAVFNFSRQRRWFATQNMCPHKQDMVLARGLLGEKNGEPKVACPQHKKQFSLETGKCLSGDDRLCIRVFDVKVENGDVLLHVPAQALASIA